MQGWGWLDDGGVVLERRRRACDARAVDVQDPDRARRAAARSTSTFYDAPNREETIHRSKAVGEPPLMLALSGFHALRDAIASVADYRRRPRCRRPRRPSAFCARSTTSDARDGASMRRVTRRLRDERARRCTDPRGSSPLAGALARDGARRARGRRHVDGLGAARSRGDDGRLARRVSPAPSAAATSNSRRCASRATRSRRRRRRRVARALPACRAARPMLRRRRDARVFDGRPRRARRGSTRRWRAREPARRSRSSRRSRMAPARGGSWSRRTTRAARSATSRSIRRRSRSRARASPALRRARARDASRTDDDATLLVHIERAAIRFPCSCSATATSGARSCGVLGVLPAHVRWIDAREERFSAPTCRRTSTVVVTDAPEAEIARRAAPARSSW